MKDSQHPDRATADHFLAKMNKNNRVDHPKHYNSHPSGIECIVIVRHMNFNLGNVFKYIWREGEKSDSVPLEDLEKAKWYLNDEIERRKKLGK